MSLQDRNGGLLASGAGGAGGVFTARSTPAEDVVDAVGRLNRALAAAAREGWLVTVSVDEVRPNFAGEGAIVPNVRANLQKQV